MAGVDRDRLGFLFGVVAAAAALADLVVCLRVRIPLRTVGLRVGRVRWLVVAASVHGVFTGSAGLVLAYPPPTAPSSTNASPVRSGSPASSGSASSPAASRSPAPRR